MERPSDAAIQIEVVKTHLRQSKEGTAITLVFHPNDNAAPIIQAPVGTRYTCFFLELDDQEQPVVRELDEGRAAVASSNLLCRDLRFQEWMLQNKLADEATEAAVILGVRRWGRVKSRSEFGTDSDARGRWWRLKSQFDADMAYKSVNGPNR